MPTELYHTLSHFAPLQKRGQKCGRVSGKPEISHNPSLSAKEEAKREYRILGAETLDAPEPWDDVKGVFDLDAAGYRFFKVEVRMKE